MNASLPKWLCFLLLFIIPNLGSVILFFFFSSSCERAPHHGLICPFRICFAPNLPHLTKRHCHPPIPSCQNPGVTLNSPLYDSKSCLFHFQTHPLLSMSTTTSGIQTTVSLKASKALPPTLLNHVPIHTHMKTQ